MNDFHVLLVKDSPNLKFEHEVYYSGTKLLVNRKYIPTHKYTEILTGSARGVH
jgi:hypothetical protein